MKISQAEIDELKRKYGLLLLVKIPVEKDETAEFIITYPHVEDLKNLSRHNLFDDIQKVLHKVVLAGDKQYIEDGKLFNASIYLSLMQVVRDVIISVILNNLNTFCLYRNYQKNESQNNQTNHSGA